MLLHVSELSAIMTRVWHVQLCIVHATGLWMGQWSVVKCCSLHGVQNVSQAQSQN